MQIMCSYRIKSQTIASQDGFQTSGVLKKKNFLSRIWILTLRTATDFLLPILKQMPELNGSFPFSRSFE